jgi:hypothetical protein
MPPVALIDRVEAAVAGIAPQTPPANPTEQQALQQTKALSGWPREDFAIGPVPIVADQEALIANLRAAKRPTANAEAALYTYLTALRHLEDHERKIKEGLKAKIGETRKPIPN